MSKVVLLVCLFLSSSLWAKLCRPVDLRADFGPVRDQKETYWCYAFSASDLIQQHFKLKKQISAVDVAFTYNQGFPGSWHRVLAPLISPKFNSGEPETGFIKLAIKRVIARGLCPESLFPSSRGALKINRETGESVALGWRESIKEMHELKRLSLRDEYFSFPGMDWAAFWTVLDNSSDKKLMYNLATWACEGHRIQVPQASLKTVYLPSNAAMLLDQQLNRGESAAIDYFSAFMYDQNAKKEDLHTSVIAGRRMGEAGECEYLIRNTYGTDCSEYVPPYQCENGYLWVSESVINRMTVGVTFFK